MAFYHLSKADEPIRLEPRLPDNYLVRMGYENDSTPRICMSNSISGCLASIGRNQDLSGESYIIHVVDEYDGTVKSNVEVRNEVPDAHITDEIWLMNHVTTHIIGDVKVIEALSPPVHFTYGGKFTYPIKFWKFEEHYY